MIAEAERANRTAGAGAPDWPLRLTGRCAWTVRSGRVDVFATRVEAGEPTGRRTHLFRVEAGGLLLGVVETASMALIAVGTPGSAVDDSGPDLSRFVRPAKARGSYGGHPLEGWIRQVYGGLHLDGKIPQHRLIDAGTRADVAPFACVRSTAPVGWLVQISGRCALASAPRVVLGAGAALPLTPQAWVEALEPSSIRLLTTEALLERDEARGEAGGVWRALDLLHGALLESVAGRVRASDLAGRDRVRRQAGFDRAAMTSVVTRLAATMESVPAGQPVMRMRARGDEEDEGRSIVPAFRLVATAAGIDVGELRRSGTPVVPKDAVQYLARASRVRTRRVALRGRWWTEDAGPLLGRLAEHPRAVALIPRARGGYKLVDPHDRTEVAVDENVAATLDAFAYALYRPFGGTTLRVWDLLRFGLHGSRRDLVVIALTGVVVAVLGLAAPLVVAVLYDTVVPGAEREELGQLTLGLVLIAFVTAVLQIVRSVALLRVEARLGPSLQAAVWDRLLRLPLPFFRGYTSGELAVRAMGVEEMRSIASSTAMTALLNGVLTLVNFALLFTYDARLAAVASALIAGAAAVSVTLSSRQLQCQRTILPLRSRTSGLVLQLLTGLAKIRVAGAEVHAFSLWARLFSAQRERQFRARALQNLHTAFAVTFPVIATLILFHFAAPGAPAGAGAGPHALGLTAGPGPGAALSTGEFLSFMTAFGLALSAMLASSTALVGALSIIPLYEQIRPILDTAPEEHTGRRDPGELAGRVEVQHLTFRYRPDGAAILRDVSISAEPGEFIALVGPSGSGKSTILRLLLGFEAAESGAVYYDGQDLSGLDVEAVRRQIGAVTQSGRIMAGDVYTNIVGSTAASVQDAWAAASMAGLDEDIRAMPMGMHTVLSDGGGTISGGQRQRLMIARALLRRPRILLFDEATSALDNRTQDVVSRSLDHLMSTRIVVAHRLSTVRNADRIYVIQAGSVVEAGTFDELLARGGVFADLARRQLL